MAPKSSRTIVAFVNDTLSGVTQYYRTIGNIWDSLYSNITLDRVYIMLAEFLIELKLNEEQDKITQIVTGSTGAAKHSMYDDYVNASKGKVPSKGKGKGGDGKGGKLTWRAPCNEFWVPEGCSQGHHCPKYHPRRQPGRCAYVAPRVTIPLNAHVQSSLKPRMPSGMTPHGSRKKSNGRSLHGRLKGMKLPRQERQRQEV